MKQHEIIIDKANQSKFKESLDAIDSHVLKKIKILKEHEKVQEMTALKNEVITLINDNKKSMKKNMSELEVKMTQLQEAKVKVEELLQQLEDRSKCIE